MNGNRLSIGALASFVGDTTEREQTVCTPPMILDPLREEWGGIDLDPCSDPGRSVGAAHSVTLADGMAMPRAGMYSAIGGLAIPWIGRVYVNPPFDDLVSWLGKAVREAAKLQCVIALLAPVRSHRVWYRAAADAAHAVIQLDPVTFVGFDQSFPQACELFYWNWIPTQSKWTCGRVRRNSEPLWPCP